MASSEPELHKHQEIIKKSTRIEEGIPTRFHLNPETNSHDESEQFKKITFGERDEHKPHKTILMVGETGTGKTKLINTMINYMLDVQREDQVWFEITDDQSDRTSVHSQTSIITVYEFYLPESKTDLTIINTPGYGDKSAEKEKKIAMSLLKLSKNNDLVSEIDAVCLVIKSTQTRLSERQMYIFDAVQSLFGTDIAENIVLLFTHSRGAVSKNALTAVKENKIKCAMNYKNQPVFFLFDNCQSDAAAADEEDKIQEHSWDLSFRGMEGFFKLLNNIKPKTLQMTQNVLQQRDNLEAKISEIQSHVQNEDRKKNELKQTQEALEENKKNKNMEVKSTKTNKNKLSAESVVISCTVCQETCDSGCWSFIPLSWSSVMKDYHCTVCTNKCSYTKHVKEAKIYVTKTKNDQPPKENEETKNDQPPKENEETKNDQPPKENEVTKNGQMTNENSEKDRYVKFGGSVFSIKKSEEEPQETGEIKLVFEAFHCVETLETIALNTDSLFTLLHIDFLIEKLKEINQPEKVKTLENIKKRAGEEKNKLLEYMKRCVNQRIRTAHSESVL